MTMVTIIGELWQITLDYNINTHVQFT